MVDIFTELDEPDLDRQVFTESNETLGLLIDSYENLPEKVESFLGVTRKWIESFVDDPNVELTELHEAIERFKTDTALDHQPELIDPAELKSQRKRIMAVKKRLDPLLAELAKLRNRIAFGGNLIRGIIRRPKVYVKDYRDTEGYDRTNQNLRTANRALDWVEKVLLDLYNLADQDLNLLTLVNTVYLKRHIYEAGDPSSGTIRPVTSTDLDHVIPWLLTTNEFEGNPSATEDSFDREMITHGTSWNNYVYGYELNGKIEGFIRGKQRRKPDGNYLAVSFLFVNPQFQGQGIGKRLLRYLIGKHGYDLSMRLNVFTDNDVAIGLYRSNGFYAEDIKVIEELEGENPKFLGKSIYKMFRPIAVGSNNYDPPLSLDKLPDRLKSDKVHRWRAITGIELIHREPSIAEQVRIWENWQRMTDRMKSISDEKCREFFGLTNEEHNAKCGELEPETTRMIIEAAEEEQVTETNKAEEEPAEKEKASRPKQVDAAEAPKNGVKRKQLYMDFIAYAKRVNPKNTFGSVFDKDAFKVTYPFVPEEMRYFYRLANPLLCLLDDDTVLFSLADLRKVNTDNPDLSRWLIFGADRTPDQNDQTVYVFDRTDKGIYCLDEKGIGKDETIGTETKGGSKVGKVADSFDHYLEQLAGIRVL